LITLTASDIDSTEALVVGAIQTFKLQPASRTRFEVKTAIRLAVTSLGVG
jgi:hypothetical protein